MRTRGLWNDAAKFYLYYYALSTWKIFPVFLATDGVSLFGTKKEYCIA